VEVIFAPPFSLPRIASPTAERRIYSRQPGLNPGFGENLLLFARKFLPSFWGLVAFSSFP
jgi:hypothetical protein